MAIVSLIIPCYNMEKYIDKCLDSVLLQTHKDIQLIVVNDGSTDASELILSQRSKEIEETLSEYIYISQQNGGVAAACCSGFKRATGKYLALLDSDDQLMPDSIKKQHDFLESHLDCVLVRTNGWYVREDDGKIIRLFRDSEETGDLFTNLLIGKSDNWSGSYMIRMSVLDEIYPDRNIYLSKGGQNLQFVLASAYKRKSGYINEPLMKYTVKDNSLSHFSNHDSSKRINALLDYKDIREHIVKEVVDEFEIEEYLQTIGEKYARIFMGLGTEIQDHDLLKQSYDWLKKKGLVTTKDKITYYNETNLAFGLFYRIVNKLKSLSR